MQVMEWTFWTNMESNYSATVVMMMKPSLLVNLEQSRQLLCVSQESHKLYITKSQEIKFDKSTSCFNGSTYSLLHLAIENGGVVNQGFDADPPEYKLVNETADKKDKKKKKKKESSKDELEMSPPKEQDEDARTANGHAEPVGGDEEGKKEEKKKKKKKKKKDKSEEKSESAEEDE